MILINPFTVKSIRLAGCDGYIEGYLYAATTIITSAHIKLHINGSLYYEDDINNDEGYFKIELKNSFTMNSIVLFADFWYDLDQYEDYMSWYYEGDNLYDVENCTSKVNLGNVRAFWY